MGSNLAKFKNELNALIDQGNLLRVSLASDLGVDVIDPETGKKLKQRDLKSLPNFKENYESWYSVSMQVIKQVLPDRLGDFVKHYKDERRKNTTFATYGVSDYMIGLRVTRGLEEVVGAGAARPKFDQQLDILKSAQARLESSLFDMLELLQADLYDNELDAAAELAKKGFLRGAGAVAGVVLERHLSHVCGKHNLKTPKRSSTIDNFNQTLKKWRRH